MAHVQQRKAVRIKKCLKFLIVVEIVIIAAKVSYFVGKKRDEGLYLYQKGHFCAKSFALMKGKSNFA